MENNLVKRSIFKQPQRKKVYVKKYYKDEEPIFDYEYEELEQYSYECSISMPLLEKDSGFYIEKDDKTVYIKNVIRTSKDNVLYECYYNTIDDNDERAKVKKEVDDERLEWEDKNKAKKLQEAEENRKSEQNEIKGIRKFVKNLFKL